MSRTLKDWEAYLSKQMPRVRLLSELGLNYEDMLEIANLIKGENKRHKNVRQTTKDLVDDFPCTFVAFLAAFAAQNTEREFWDAVGRRIDINSGDLSNANWRRHFIEILKAHQITTFEDVGGSTNKYVTSMRIHGGIPAYSLRDFFANMLMPSIENPEYIELKGAELRDALLARSSVQMFTDSTVRNFFENTEEIGVEYLEACRRVAKSYNSTRQISDLHGLPNYVVEKLTNFLEYQEDEKRGLRRPRIKFDPEGDGLLVELPEEPISGVDVRGGQIRWQILQSQKILKENLARILRSGRDVHSEEQVIPLGYLIEPFQVTFSLPNQEGGFNKIREWIFDIRSVDAPNLLVFRSEDGSLLRWSQALPAHDLLLVHPKDISLEFEGDARLIHSPDMYAEGWHNWRAEYRSLVEAFSLSLLQNGKTLSTISIQKQLELPRLVGYIFEPNLDSKPLYLGGAPKLRIPLRPGVDPVEELKRWRIEINSAWEAEPFIRQEFKLSEKAKSVALEESALEFDLVAVLGDEPKGTYTLRACGPLETDVEFPFRVWNSLQVKDLPEYILPAEDSKVTLNFSVPARTILEAQAGVTGITITGQAGEYAVELDESVSQLDLNLTWETEASVIHVPFSLPIPHIKWRLVLGEDSKIEWSNRSIRKPVDAFLQSTHTPALFVQMPGIENHARQLTLRLIDPENPKAAFQEFPAQPHVLGSSYVRFLLNAKDTLNQHKDISVFEFELLLVNKEGLYQPINLLSLTRDINVSNVRIEEMDDSLFLLWDEPSPLKNRRIFIRSMWKVWADAWNIKIPDDAPGKFDLLTAGYGLPPSWYEVHFYVAPSWEKDITSVPAHSTFMVKRISPEDQITWLDENLQKFPDQSFINHFERACIYAAVKNISKREQEIQYCYSHIDRAKPKDLLAFHEWIEKYEPETARAVRMKMYNPEQLQGLYAAYKFGDNFRQKYLTYVPQTNIKPESAILLIENENSPSIVFHALRELVKRKDHRLLGILEKMLETGRLSDADAIMLLKQEKEHYVSDLNSTQSSKINMRLLSGLLHNQNELIRSLSSEKIISLAKAELTPLAVKKYLDILIGRGEKYGVELTMELFQSGRLRGDEVTDILGKNPKFSTRILSNAPQAHAYSIQISEIARKFPFETGHVSVGMFVKTPVGWGEITSMTGMNGDKTQIASIEKKQILYYHVTLESELEHPIMAVLDMEKQQMRLVNAKQIYMCGHCDFVSMSQNYIIRFHTREMHSGISPSLREIPSKTAIRGELQFSSSRPIKEEVLDSRQHFQTVLGKIATDPLSIASARQRNNKSKK